jgi:hypothetical protein
LLLAARKLRRIVIAPRAEPNLLQKMLRLNKSIRILGQLERKRDIF